MKVFTPFFIGEEFNGKIRIKTKNYNGI